MLEAIAIKHPNVHGKETPFLKVTNGVSTVIIKIAEKTYTDIKELETPPKKAEEPELPFNGEGTPTTVDELRKKVEAEEPITKFVPVQTDELNVQESLRVPSETLRKMVTDEKPKPKGTKS